MERLKILIVDDTEEYRTVLKSICTEMECFEVREGCDGLEALDIVEEWHPHIVLIDVMLPGLDGFEASKIIKSRYPQTTIMAIAGGFDPNMEKNMASIGVAAYVHKPIDKKLIRFKLQSFGALYRSKEGEYKRVKAKEALNPFSPDVRHFKTVFTISDSESMMDFGLWILARYDDAKASLSPKVDVAVEFLYELMRQSVRNAKLLGVIIEESFEDIFITMKCENTIELKPKAQILLEELGELCVVKENIACVRLRISEKGTRKVQAAANTPPAAAPVRVPSAPSVPAVPEPTAQHRPAPPTEPAQAKEVRIIESKENEILRKSFVQKTSAADYIRDIGGDVLDEIRDLESLDAEWIEKLHDLEAEPSVGNIRDFADGVLGVYVRAINNLFEFTALAYALSSLSVFLKEHAETIVSDPSKLKMLVMLLEHLGLDLTSWRDHIFALQDTADIHYLDSSFFSSCMQIEGIITNKEVASDDDDDGIEFF